MKTKDITLTTGPEKVQLYAFGSANSRYFHDGDLPGIVLAVEKGTATTLQYRDPELDRGPNRYFWTADVPNPATLFDKLNLERLLQFVRLSERRRSYGFTDEAKAQLESLRARLPEGWHGVFEPTSRVRMPWSEYVSWRSSEREVRERNQQQKQEADRKRMAEVELISDELESLGLPRLPHWATNVNLTFEQYHQLVDRTGKD